MVAVYHLKVEVEYLQNFKTAYAHSEQSKFQSLEVHLFLFVPQLKGMQTFQNGYEAEFLSCLLNYLLLQGYDSSEITVLSTYMGQQYYFQKVKPRLCVLFGTESNRPELFRFELV